MESRKELKMEKFTRNMETEMQNMNKEIHLKIKTEKFESDKFSLENVDYTYCFENIDSHVKMEIDVHDNLQSLLNECSYSPNIVNQHQNARLGTSSENINQHGRFKEEKFGNDKSYFENVDYTHYFENVDFNFPDKSKEDDKSVQIMHIKQENIDNYEQTEKTKNPKDGSKLKKHDFEAETVYLKSRITLNSCVNFDLKPENVAVSNENSDLKHESNGPYVYMGDGNIPRTSNFNLEDISSFSGRLDLKIEFTVLNIEKRNLKSEKPDLNINRFVSDVGVIDFMTNRCEKEIHLGTDIISDSLEYPYFSKLCNKGFKTTDYLKNHMNRHSTERPHKYNICEAGFKRKFELKNLMISHSTEEPHKCKVCEKVLKTKGSLRQHMIRHSTDRPHKCTICEAGFKSKSILKKHILTHSTEQPYKCNMCENVFKTKHTLRYHILTHSTEHAYKCNMCEKSFKTMQTLRKHMTTHSTEKPHKCNICEAGFKLKSYLGQHMISHSTEYLHKCNICEKAFKTTKHLSIHMLIHSTEHPHKCNMCEKAFKAKRSLISHMISHSMEHRFKCNICEKGFKTCQNLRQHMMSHSTERPHKFNMCEAGFKTRPHLKAHMHTHSN